MTGFMSTLPHIITVVLLWIAVLAIAQIIRVGIFKSIGAVQCGATKKQIKKNDERKREIKKIVTLINIGATVIAAAVVVLIILFLSNPLERTGEEIKTIAPAQIDETFEAPSKEEINTSNKEVIEKKHREKEKEAERDNIKAMEEATDIFRKAAEEADKN